MLNLILTMMAIALGAVYLETTIGYINPSAIYSSQYASSLNRGLVGLKKGYDSYVTANNGDPTSLSDVTPKYAFLPPTPKGMSWSFGNGTTAGQYFCMSGRGNQALINALKADRSYFSTQAYFISSSCGATAESVPTIGGSSQTTTVALTYWVQGY